MTATNHAITGAAVALAIRQPLLAVPLAFVSHFVMDAIPHYEPKGVTPGLNSGIKKIKIRSFQIYLCSDLLMFVLLLIILPIALNNHIQWWLVLSCSLVAAVPDLTWGWHLYRAKIGQKIIKPSWLTRFHIWTQWMEKPWGIYVELTWFLLMVWAVKRLIS